MATSKRERQRANREVRKVEMEKQAKRAQLTSRIRRIAIWAIVVAAVLFVANIVF